MGDRFRKLRRLYLARDYRVFINEEPRSSVARTILSLDSVYLGDLAENRLLNRHFSAAQAACPRAKGSAVINSRA
jgi:predicted SpoU family rRNA methylase